MTGTRQEAQNNGLFCLPAFLPSRISGLSQLWPEFLLSIHFHVFLTERGLTPVDFDEAVLVALTPVDVINNEREKLRAVRKGSSISVSVGDRIPTADDRASVYGRRTRTYDFPGVCSKMANDDYFRPICLLDGMGLTVYEMFTTQQKHSLWCEDGEQSKLASGLFHSVPRFSNSDYVYQVTRDAFDLAEALRRMAAGKTCVSLVDGELHIWDVSPERRQSLWTLPPCRPDPGGNWVQPHERGIKAAERHRDVIKEQRDALRLRRKQLKQ